jgi:hypothetical protein
LLKKDIDGASPKGCRIVGKKKPSARGGLDRHVSEKSIVGVDVHVFGFLDKQGAND